MPDEKNFNKLIVSSRSGAIFEKEELWVTVGKKIVTDAFLVGFWENKRPTQVLLETGVIIGENVRKGKPMRMPEPGWSSWHSFERQITEKQTMLTTDFINKNLKANTSN